VEHWKKLQAANGAQRHFIGKKGFFVGEASSLDSAVAARAASVLAFDPYL
jgi:hypothetical protein